MKIKVFSLGLFLIFLFGCTPAVKHYLLYDIHLEDVERPAEAIEQFKEQTISATGEEGYTHLFEDDLTKVLWLPDPEEFRFLLENKTDDSIRIIWNEAAYVNEKGESFRVIHAGIKYIDRDRPQLPSVVQAKEMIKDFVYPADYISLERDTWAERPMISLGWMEKPLLPYVQKGGDPQEFLNSAQSHLGKTLQVILPIQFEGVTYNYVFTFKIKDIYLAPKQ